MLTIRPVRLTGKLIAICNKPLFMMFGKFSTMLYMEIIIMIIYIYFVIEYNNLSQLYFMIFYRQRHKHKFYCFNVHIYCSSSSYIRNIWMIDRSWTWNPCELVASTVKKIRTISMAIHGHVSIIYNPPSTYVIFHYKKNGSFNREIFLWHHQVQTCNA